MVNVVQSKPDFGPPKVRRMFTTTWERWTGQIVVTSSQWSTLETFFTTTLGGGALKFTWVHPVSGAVCYMRFQPGTTPTVGGFVGASATVVLSLEVVA
jgi:hypothetical protein